MRTYLVNTVAAANNAGVLCGAYHFVSATNVQTGAEADNLSAETQANFLVDNVIAAGGYNKIKLPLCIDIEGDGTTGEPYASLSKSEVTNIAKAFALAVSKRGFVPCLYLNKSFMLNKYDMDQLGYLPLWYACWNADETTARTECPQANLWQTGTATVPGISTEVDHNKCFYTLLSPTDSEGAIHLNLQTKTGSSIYLDYCEKKAYIPTSFTSTTIRSNLRSINSSEYSIVIRDTQIALADSIAERQVFDIVRI